MWKTIQVQITCPITPKHRARILLSVLKIYSYVYVRNNKKEIKLKLPVCMYLTHTYMHTYTYYMHTYIRVICYHVTINTSNFLARRNDTKIISTGSSMGFPISCFESTFFVSPRLWGQLVDPVSKTGRTCHLHKNICDRLFHYLARPPREGR